MVMTGGSSPNHAVGETLSLGDFLARMEALDRRPTVPELRDMMRSLDIRLDDVRHCADFGEHGYRRNLLHAGAHFHALILCWRSGQRSPVHDHARSICGVRILRGRATETLFERTPCGQYKAVSSDDYVAGQVLVSQDADVHQMSNLQPAADDLVTLHVYAPPLLRMKQYSLDDGSEREFVDTIAGFMHGEGI